MITRKMGAVLLAGFALAVSLRMPHILFGGGRFWAEEGTVYFAAAVTQPWYRAWFVVHTGYINFAAGFGTWLGLHLGGVAGAPLVTVILALLIQCLPVWVALTHDFPWRRSTIAAAAAVALIAIQPVTGEVWLSTITSQFHLVLAAALILAAPERRAAMFRVDCALLAFAVMSGPATSFLMPFFVFEAMRRRDRAAIVQAVILSLGFLIQVAMFLLHPLAVRGAPMPADQLLSAIGLHTIVLQFAGFDPARAFAHFLLARHHDHHVLWMGPILLALYYGLVLAAIVRARDGRLLRLQLAGLAIVLISFREALFGSFAGFMSVVGGQRYAFVPMVINALVLVGLAAGARGAWRKALILPVAVLLVVGALNFRQGLALFRTGPAWRPQVAVWRRHPRKVLRVWPGGGWVMTMPAAARHD